MRKIISKAKEKKKIQKNQLVIGGILILVMVLSVLGFSIGRNDEDKEEIINYQGFKFTKQNGLWILNLNKLQFSFMYNPNEIENSNEILNPLNNYLDKPLYIYSEKIEAETEIYKNLFYYNKIVERVQKACPVGEDCGEEIPIKTCKDNFIIIRESNESSIRQEENCVFIEGKKEDLIKLTDSFLFKIIGIQ